MSGVVVITGASRGIGEEIGWRGYLLPHLMKLGQLRASITTGFLHGVWHLPLLLLTPFYHQDGNRWIVVALFLVALPQATTDPLLIFIGCYQIPMYLTPVLLGRFYGAAPA